MHLLCYMAVFCYRAAMAMLRQEAAFVEQLYATAMIDELEHEQLLEPIERRERKLHREGAVWRTPLVTEVWS